MIKTNITEFQKDINSILENTIRYNQPVNINTKDGNAVVISETDYQSLIETLYITSIPQMREKIADGLDTPLSECIPESEVKW